MSIADRVATRLTQPGRRWQGLTIRLGASLGLLLASGLVVVHSIALWHFRRGTPAEIARAIQWEPGNAEFYAARARALHLSIEGTDVDEVIRLYEKAARLSPGRALHWAELGGSYEWAGREEDARRAFERARELFPNSPEINWKLGNFYIRAGKNRDALQAFRKTLLGDPDMRRPAFDLVWRGGLDNQSILVEMIPADMPVLIAYLNYLVEMRRMDDASQVWSRLLESGDRLEPEVAFPYMDALIESRRIEQLKFVWAGLMRRNRGASQRGPAETNLITDASFEDEILNGGLDWRVTPVEGVTVSVDTLVFFDGARSLRLHFDGTRNVDYGHVVQFVPVEPKTEYRFLAYARARDVTSDAGPRFQISDAHNPAQLSVSTESVLGTINWTPLQLQFTTGPETRLLALRLVRPQSRKFDGRISGTLWADRLSLVAVE